MGFPKLEEIDVLFHCWNEMCQRTPRFVVLAQTLWSSLAVVRTDHCVPYCDTGRRQCLAGAYIPPKLAAMLEDPERDAVPIWVRTERPTGLGHAAVGWTMDYNACASRAVWPAARWRHEPARFRPRICLSGEDPDSYFDFDPTIDNAPLKCVVCYANDAGVRIVPCGHKILCVCCFTALAKRAGTGPLRCPLCRGVAAEAARDDDAQTHRKDTADEYAARKNHWVALDPYETPALPAPKRRRMQ
jgi:hypothetical protein